MPKGRWSFLVVLAGSLCLSDGLEARGVPATWGPSEAELEARLAEERAAVGLGRRLEIEALAALPDAESAAADELAALIEHNLAGRLPTQVGFERPLPREQRVVLSDEIFLQALPGPHAGGVAEIAYGERLVWTARIEVAGASGIRFLLADARLPEGTRVWTYGEAGRVRGPVGPAQVVGGRLWTPIAFADAVYLEVDVPLEVIQRGEGVEFSVDRVAEIFRLDERGVPLTGPRLQPKTHTPLPDCLVDGMCKDSGDLSFIEDYRKSVANLFFDVGGSTFTCTGGLLNTAEGPGQHLLTASHCFSTPASAASLDARWDHVTDECDGTDPGPGAFPSTTGSTLLATSSDSDFTLVEITPSLPAGRYYLGWTAAQLADGTTLHRLHHPSDDAQHYSRGTVDHTGPIECPGFERPRFLYSQLEEGGQVGGSSGSVVVIDAGGGQVVGQLFGICGTNIGDRCDFDNNRTVDGAFELTHVATREWLDPDQAAGFDVAFPLSGFTLSGGDSTVRNFECLAADAGDVIAFSFRGTVSGISGNLSFASDLRLQLSGPSSSSYDVGGFDNLVNEWPFQGEQSTGDGAYRSSHITVLDSNGDGTSSCEGTWSATFTNDWSRSGAVSWSDVAIVLHKVAPAGALCADGLDSLVLENQTVTGTELFEACRTITAGPDFTVGSTGDVTFRAGEKIILRDGFSVASGGSFVAGIDPSLAP